MNPKQKIIVAVFASLLLAGILIISIVLSVQSNKATKQPLVTTKVEENGVRVTTSASQAKSPSDGDNPSTSTAPTNPNGAFVSNHHPDLDGSPAPNKMNSVCQTTAGATCEIRFIKDGVIKTLGPTKVGSDGYAIWDWKLQDIGLTEGSWQIEALANSGGKTATTKDDLSLEVGS
jgi:hypothetical protein